MVVEYIRYSVEEDRADAFEQAYRRASDSLDKSEHCERYEVALSRGSGAACRSDRVGFEEGHLLWIPTERGVSELPRRGRPVRSGHRGDASLRGELSTTSSVFDPSTRLERRHGGPHGREEPSGPISAVSPVLEDLALPLLQPREAERDPTLLQIGAELPQSVDRGCVEVGPRLGVEDEPSEVVSGVDQQAHDSGGTRR